MHHKFRAFGLLVAIVVTTAAHVAMGQAEDTPGKTAFKIDPLTALQSPLLATDDTATSATEFDLLQHASRNKMDHWSMARAALVISGVEDKDEQKTYLAKLAEIAAGCKEATANAHTQLAKAKALGKYLIENPLSAGYVSMCYKMPVMLDSGHYNCVSSAVLYSIMAEKCDLNVRAITMSNHVFLRALDFDIEPTNGHAYSIADRDDRLLSEQARAGKKTSAAYMTFPYRETGRLGLLSTMYQDAASGFRKNQQYEASVSTYLKAACFDPKDPSTLQNLRSTLKTWSKESKRNHQDAKANEIDAFAKSLLRDPSVLNKTRAL